MTGDEIIIFARGVVNEDRRGELLARMAELQRIAAGEAGTLLYEWCSDLANPSVVWTYEIYADAEALDVHRRSVLPLLRDFAACFVEPPTPHRCTPLTIPL